MRLLILLLSSCVMLFTCSRFAHAAECCGSRGKDTDETTLWNTRAILCNNPGGQPKAHDGHIAKASVRFGTTITEYAFWAKDEQKSYSHCWEATQNLIEQCFRGGQGAGSWHYGSEFYAMTATSQVTYDKRSNLSIDELPTLPSSSSGTIHDIVLENGTYNILGMPVHISVSGIDLSAGRLRTPHARGLDPLQTQIGPVTNYTILGQPTIDLAASLRQLLTDALGQEGSVPTHTHGLSTRSNICRGSKRYLVVEYGYWSTPYKFEDLNECGQGCYEGFSQSVTTTESFSIGVDAGIAAAIASFGLSLAGQWDRSYTTATDKVCTWPDGGCHTIWRRQPMAYQKGFVLEVTLLPGWDYRWTTAPVTVDIKWVHSDAPSGHAQYLCKIGCCFGPATKRYTPWDKCIYAAGKECWYGVCANYDDNCWGAQPDCSNWELARD